MLVTTGLHDSQVQYFEPAKWVAKLRATQTGSAPLLLKTNMEAGHGGKSGRFRRLQEVAEAWAFFLDQLGVPVETPAGDGFEGDATAAPAVEAKTADGFEGGRHAH